MSEWLGPVVGLLPLLIVAVVMIVGVKRGWFKPARRRSADDAGAYIDGGTWDSGHHGHDAGGHHGGHDAGGHGGFDGGGGGHH